MIRILLAIVMLCFCQNVNADFNSGDTFGKGIIIQSNGTTISGGGRTLNFGNCLDVSVVGNAYLIAVDNGCLAPSTSGNVVTYEGLLVTYRGQVVQYLGQ